VLKKIPQIGKHFPQIGKHFPQIGNIFRKSVKCGCPALTTSFIIVKNDKVLIFLQ
jgi:hypothetical protein